MRFLLERAGYEVLAACNGHQGMELARQELPDLIVMDLALAEVDGWTAARELKADPKTAHIPVLALTAHTLPGDRNRTLESGFDEYISKPINVLGLTESIAKALQSKTKTIKANLLAQRRPLKNDV